MTSYLYHVYKTVGAGWTLQQIQDGGMGQPSVVAGGINSIDLVARGWDSNVIHTYSSDNLNFSSESRTTSVPIPQTIPTITYKGLIGPPTIISPASGILDTFVQDIQSTMAFATDNRGAWSGFSAPGTNRFGTGPAGRLPLPVSVAAKDASNMAYFGMTGTGSAFVNAMVGGSWYSQSGGLKLPVFSLMSPFGEITVASNANGVDVVWQDRVTFSYNHRHFSSNQFSWGLITNSQYWSVVQNLGGQ